MNLADGAALTVPQQYWYINGGTAYLPIMQGKRCANGKIFLAGV